MKRGASVVPILHTVTWKCLLIMWLTDPLCWFGIFAMTVTNIHYLNLWVVSQPVSAEAETWFFAALFHCTQEECAQLHCFIHCHAFWCYALIRVPANLGHATTACFTMFFSSSVIYKNITQRRIKLLASLWQIVCHLNLRCSITRATLP